MDALPFADALVKEYLAFRGASGSLQAFCRETSAEDAAFDASRLSALLFKLIASLDVRAVVDFLDLLNSRLYSRLDARYEDVIADAEDDVLRAFVVTALTARRRDAAIAFFSSFGPQLLASSARPSRRGSLVGPASPPDWREWFVLPYLEHPERQPGFQVYFSAEWRALLEASFTNLLSGVLRALPLPALLQYDTERRLRHALQQQVTALTAELESAKEQLADAQQAHQQAQEQMQQAKKQPHEPHDQVAGPAMNTVGSPHQHLQAHGGRGDAGQAAVLPQPHPAVEVVSEGSGLELFQLLPGGCGSGKEAGVVNALPESRIPAHSHSHSRTASFSGICFENSGGEASTAADAVACHQQQLDDGGCAPHHSTAADAGGGKPHAPLQQLPQEQEQEPIKEEPVSAAGRSRWQRTSVARQPEQQGLPSSQAGAGGAVVSWSDGLLASGATSGMRARHMHHKPAAGAGCTITGSGGAVLGEPGLRGHHSAAVACVMSPHGGGCPGSAVGGEGATGAAVYSACNDWLSLLPPPPPPRTLLPCESPADSPGSPPSCILASIDEVQHSQSPLGVPAVSCAVAFSPLGGNAASALGASGAEVWVVPGVAGGNQGRVGCAPPRGPGAPVVCLSWDGRADKQLLLGCAGAGGGVRVWHADTRRIIGDVPAEPGHPYISALAACPVEPAFAVAANSQPAGGGSSAASGRLDVYNGRTFRRSMSLSLPGVGPPLASLAWNGGRLLAGTQTGGALLFEPAVRVTPLQAWRLHYGEHDSGDGDTGRGGGGGGGGVVQVAWRSCSNDSSSASVLALHRGVLTEWEVDARVGCPPLAALDVAAAAAAACQAACSSSSSSSSPSPWACSMAPSPDGSRVAVACCGDDVGVLLLYNPRGAWCAAPSVLLVSPVLKGMLAGLSWHPYGEPVLLVERPNVTLVVRLQNAGV